MRLAAAILVCAATLSAADFDGTWLGRIPRSNSDGSLLASFQEIAFQIVRHGDGIEGKFYGEERTSVITEGKVTGDEITFVVVAPEQQSNNILETRLRFTGKMTNNGEIERTRIRESATNAIDGTPYKYRPENSKHTFHLRRLF